MIFRLWPRNFDFARFLHEIKCFVQNTIYNRKELLKHPVLINYKEWTLHEITKFQKIETA